MTNELSKIKDDQTIESIIFAFWCDYCCAAKRNLDDALVVGQLSACLLEHFSGFLYDGPADQRIAQFVATYLEPYSEMGLYTALRNSLDHQMVGKLGTAMTGIPGRMLKNGWVGLDERKVLDVFSKDLQDAIKKAGQDLRSDDIKKQHALTWLRDHPIYESKGLSLYTSEQQWQLVGYYQPLLRMHFSCGKDDPCSFGFNFGDGGYFVTVCFDDVGGREGTSRVPLEIFIELLGLKRPEEVLSERD